MKKLLITFLLFALLPLANAAQWVEIFEKQYVDLTTIEVNTKTGIVNFWVKALRKDPSDKFGGLDYWYTMDKWALNCSTKKSKIEAIAIYDLKQKLIFSNESFTQWDSIIPETYADGYYRLFCLAPFDENPFFK